MNQLNDFKVQKYLLHKMSPDEKDTFEKQLSTKPEWQEEIGMLKFFADTLNDSGLERFGERVARIRAETEDKNETIHSGRSIFRMAGRWIAAAGILLILGVPGWLAYRKHTGSAERLFRKYYHAVEVPVAYRGAGEHVEHDFLTGLEEFRKKEYGKSVEIFHSVVQQHPENIKAWFMLGESYLMNQQYQDAEDSFLLIMQKDDGDYREEAQWALGFCYLLSGEKALAGKVFGEIADRGGFYSTRAKEIINSLD